MARRRRPWRTWKVAENLRLQDAAAQLLKARRHEEGALDFETLELRAVFTDGNLTELTPLDQAGDPRFTDDNAVADTGNGTAPIVDMGALERQP